MSAKARALSLGLFPVLLLLLLVLTIGPGEAVISNEERDACTVSWTICADRCANTAKECGKNYDTCFNDCKGICDLRKSDCLGNADKDAPKVPKTKVQPKVKPGGAETPGTESPNVQPKGGIERY